MIQKALVFVLFLTASLTTFAADTPTAIEAKHAFFEKSVRPLLVEKCLECHGEKDPEGGIRFTSREAILKGGNKGTVVDLANPDASKLLKSVRHTGGRKMPPDGKLADAEIATLARWIETGLAWPESSVVRTAKKAFEITPADRQHWSFRPPIAPSNPTLCDQSWPRSSIDSFILAKLESQGIKPAPIADRRTLIRRLTYDLTGLPPTWDEVEEFVHDPANTPDAFAKRVDKLLASPRYGERWGRHWLDVARFADSKDGVLMYGDARIRPYAYTYRDYVIRAMNADTPFDQFIREQLAADQLDLKGESWRLAALGFLTLGRMYDNNIHDIIDDQIDTVTRGFLGLTVSCARCHDHKYDPVSTADYYSLYGVFASCEAPLELPATAACTTEDARAFEKQLAEKRAELQKFRDEQFELLSATTRQRTGDYLERVATSRPDPLETAIFFLSLAPEDLRPPIVARWRKYLDEHAKPEDPVFGPWHDLMQVPLVNPADARSSFAGPIDHLRKRWSSRPLGTAFGQIHPQVKEVLLKSNLTNRVEMARAYGELFQKVNAEMASKSPPSDLQKPLLAVISGPDSPTYFPRNQTRRYMSRTETDRYGGLVNNLDTMAVKSRHAVPRAMIMTDAEKPHDPRIFVRGNPSTLGRHVPRQFLELLDSQPQTPFTHGSGRLDLANAIASPQNPLTARVIVNRIWMHHFGEPLVSTPSDFGKRSTAPEHHALLDHLSTQFIRDGWSLKKLHRRILNSSTYTMSSKKDSANTDTDNRWLARANRQRLSFEAMRDTLLALSGRLENQDGGRPIDITDPKSRCRTVYGMVDRQSLPGIFRAFDFASPDSSVERRPRTMVPQQALFALNSPFMQEQAKQLIARPELIAERDATLRLKSLFRLIFQRDPTADEAKASLDFLNQSPDQNAKLSNWEAFTQVLLSSNEIMYID